MSERPRVFAKFRPWRNSIEKDTSGNFVEQNRTKEMLLNAQFFCQPPRFFDDPNDCLQGARPTGSPRDIDQFIMHNLREVPDLMRKYALSSITQLKIDKVTDPEDRKKLQRLGRKHRRRDMRVLSLSGVPECELMWAFYGDNHRGICLCFDPHHPFFVGARMVRYVEDPVEAGEPISAQEGDDPLLYVKGIAWTWQNEWRQVWAGEEPKLISFPREALKAVVLGQWFQYAYFRDLVKTLQQGGYQIPLLQMERVPESFKYQVVPIGEIG